MSRFQATKTNRAGNLGVLIGALMLSACATKHPPQPVIPTVPTISAEALGLDPNSVAQPISQTWWRALHDDTLNYLIDQALVESPDLVMVAARLAQAHAGGGLAASQLGAQVGVAANGAGVYHESLSNPDSVVSQIFGSTANYGSLQLQGKWTWDLWGANKSNLEAALGKQNATAYELAQARLLLAQAVTAQYFQLQGLAEQTEILRERVKIKQMQDRLLQDRIKAGLASTHQRFPIGQAILQLNVAIEDLNNKSAQTRNALANLTAQSPTALANLKPEPIHTLPVMPANSLTADIIGRRADIAAQREAIYSREQLLKVAVTKFYPNIEIKALSGLSVLQIGDFSSSRTLMGAILPTVTLPIFTGGALQANLDQKQGEYNEQIARYNKSVYQALKEASDALTSYQSAVRTEGLQRQMLTLAKRNQHAIQDRIKAGLETKITLLAAQDEMRQSESQLLQTQLQQRMAWLSLTAALGGGIPIDTH